jgi:hypothetical protein
MGIDLQAKAVLDSQKIHNGTLGGGGFNVDLTFTDLETIPNTETIQGLYNDTALLGISPDNGLPVRGAKIAVSFHQSDLTIWDGKSSLQRWTIQFVNGAGQTVIVEIMDVIPDRSFGDVVCICKIVSGHVE